jgi:hypothetical protein
VAMAVALTIGRASELLLAMSVSGRWIQVRTLGRDASEVEVFLAANQASDPVVEATAAVGRMQSPFPQASGGRATASFGGGERPWRPMRNEEKVSAPFLSFGERLCHGERSRPIRTDGAGRTLVVEHYRFGKA